MEEVIISADVAELDEAAEAGSPLS